MLFRSEPVLAIDGDRRVHQVGSEVLGAGEHVRDGAEPGLDAVVGVTDHQCVEARCPEWFPVKRAAFRLGRIGPQRRAVD